MVEASGFPKILMSVIGTLAAAGVLGGVGLAVAQSSLKTQVDANKSELLRQRAVVEAVPVIQADIEHVKDDMKEVKEDVEDIKDGIDEIKDALRK